MKLSKKMTILVVTIATAFSFNEDASADRYNTNVDYDLIIQHSHDLENIAAELKDCFRDQFRYSQLYGKLISRSSKIKNQSHRLHRIGTSHGQCNWHDEIHLIDELVRELDALVDNAVYRSRHGYDKPLCGNTTRIVRKLIGKANYHVNGLEKSIHRIQQNGPNLRGPIFNEPAPYFAPGKQDIGYGGNYRNNWTTKFHSAKTYQSNRNRYESTYTNQRYSPRGIDVSRNGLALNVGGFTFHLNK